MYIMEGNLEAPKFNGKITEKYNVRYKLYFDELLGDEKEVRKTIENKIKNLGLLMEKIPIDSQKFLETLHIQLTAELGRFGIKLRNTEFEVLGKVEEPAVSQ